MFYVTLNSRQPHITLLRIAVSRIYAYASTTAELAALASETAKDTPRRGQHQPHEDWKTHPYCRHRTRYASSSGRRLCGKLPVHAHQWQYIICSWIAPAHQQSLKSFMYIVTIMFACLPQSPAVALVSVDGVVCSNGDTTQGLATTSSSTVSQPLTPHSHPPPSPPLHINSNAPPLPAAAQTPPTNRYDEWIHIDAPPDSRSPAKGIQLY